MHGGDGDLISFFFVLTDDGSLASNDTVCRASF